MINKKRKETTTSRSLPPISKPIPQKINYKYASKEPLGQVIAKAIPKQFIPTKRFNTIFEGIFILVLIISLLQLPFSSLLAGNTDVSIKVGYPLTFLELELVEVEKMPIKPFGLILDLLIYVLLAYAIEISISLILRNPFAQSKEELKKRPTTFKDKKQTIIDIAAKTTAEKISKKKF